MKTNFIFDVDGTLTPSRGHINLDFAIWFGEFCLTHTVYLVTGSDKPKTVEQVGEDIYNKCKRVYQCSGSDVWQSDENIIKSEWTLPIEARHWLEQALNDSDFSIRTGNHIEHRTGMVNFSVVGRNADSIDRGKYVRYEEENGERVHIAQAFNNFFPNLQATVGGETGIDIASRGADKSQILRDFKENDTIQFYGDAMFEGGNDYPLAHALKNFQLGFSHQVTGWENTWNKLKDIT